MTIRIIVEHAKHGQVYHNATTDEQWAVASLRILTERMNAGWYYEPAPVIEPTEIDIETLPAHLKKAEEQIRNRYKTDKCEYDSEMDFWTRAKQIVDDQDLGLVTYGVKRPLTSPKAWDLLDMRDDYEYEQVELVTIND